MSGVFLSYSRGDRALADQIIRGLRGLGVEVWWDEDMPGVNWQQELERQIKELAAVVVLWTENSAASNNVRDEARLGLNTEKLVNVLSGVDQPPFPYDRVNGLPLDGWTGREPHNGWTRLVQTIEAHIAQAGGAAAGAISQALARRERDVRRADEAVASAQQAFQDAQTREGEGADVITAASAELDRAEKQHQQVVEMRGSPALLHTAQQEMEAARAAHDAAMAAQRAAKAELSEAARRLTRAKADLEVMFKQSAEPLDPDLADAPAQPPRPVAQRGTTSEPPSATAIPITPPPPPKPPPEPPPKPPLVIQPGGRQPRSPVGRLDAFLLSPRGRVDRRGFWLFLVGYQVAIGLLLLLTASWIAGAGPAGIFVLLLAAFVAYPAMVVAVKRGHDLNRGAILVVLPLLLTIPLCLTGFERIWAYVPLGVLPNPLTVLALLGTLQNPDSESAPRALFFALLINLVTLMVLGVMRGTPEENSYGPAPGRKPNRDAARPSA